MTPVVLIICALVLLLLFAAGIWLSRHARPLATRLAAVGRDSDGLTGQVIPLLAFLALLAILLKLTTF